MAYETLIVETRDHVGLIRLHRPDAMNALNGQMMDELSDALQKFDADEGIRAIVLTGSDKAFAAGADIKEMREKTFVDVYREDFITRNWEAAAKIRKPLIAAVSGYALGGGCELAMTIGAIPGAGGTQRLTRFVGKSKAMEMCLTGRFMGAEEAERSGLVSRIIPVDDLVNEALATAAKIAEMPPVAVLATKEAVNRAYETTLAEGLRFERRLFHAMFATEDQKEGMEAFVDKRKAQFSGR